MGSLTFCELTLTAARMSAACGTGSIARASGANDSSSSVNSSSPQRCTILERPLHDSCAARVRLRRPALCCWESSRVPLAERIVVSQASLIWTRPAGNDPPSASFQDRELSAHILPDFAGLVSRSGWRSLFRPRLLREQLVMRWTRRADTLVYPLGLLFTSDDILALVLVVIGTLTIFSGSVQE